MAELTCQNQELTREIHLRRQRYEAYREEQDQNQGDEKSDVPESQSRGITSRRVPHLEREIDQMRKVIDEMRENMRRTNLVEDLVHRTDSPFTSSINGHPLPPKFKMPSLDSYDGARDPFDHIATFKTTMHLQGVPDEIMCRAFPTTLKGLARVWFSKIPSNSGENESLRSFITCFNREALTVDEVDDNLLLVAFHNEVNSDLFINKLYEKEPQSIAELVHSAQNFMNAEDAIIAKKRKRAKRMDANPTCHSEQVPQPKKGQTEDKKDRDGKRAGPSVQSQQYTPLEQVLMQIKGDPSLKWPEKMKGDPNKRNRNKYCHFHRDHGNDTDECYDLKQQIENLIRQGKLRNFLGREHKDEKLKGKVEETSRPPLGEIKVIIGGSSVGQSSKSKKTYLKVEQNVQLSGRSLRTTTTDEQAITFTDADAERVHHPHDDAIVITLLIVNYTTRRAMVDNGSLADILYYPAFQQMRLG
ncbi:uncharacterized protein LOC115956740 [Quercus lobata]|uniref:uncharacterized protein LOC115956740 n=1 Tax=Quercus lobata TaxID=97700 RepID=UPI001247E43F|nr:uncharacterized protein LOC115956740 [Quercus lobata]